VLPAGADDVKIDAELSFVQDAIVWSMLPHTHLRGKRWEYRLVLPDGTSTMILAVPKYDFNWQTFYLFAEPLRVPKGSKILSSAWYDNSAGNKFNPDPKAQVALGRSDVGGDAVHGTAFQPAAPRRRADHLARAEIALWESLRVFAPLRFCGCCFLRAL
jgi:hypothetical protein